jgi:hypothetical protein
MQEPLSACDPARINTLCDSLLVKLKAGDTATKDLVGDWIQSYAREKGYPLPIPINPATAKQQRDHKPLLILHGVPIWEADFLRTGVYDLRAVWRQRIDVMTTAASASPGCGCGRCRPKRRTPYGYQLELMTQLTHEIQHLRVQNQQAKLEVQLLHAQLAAAQVPRPPNEVVISEVLKELSQRVQLLEQELHDWHQLSDRIIALGEQLPQPAKQDPPVCPS